MKRLIPALAAMLAGCSSVPADLRSHGIHVERTLQHAPREAARCIARNAEVESAAIVTYPLTETGSGGVDIQVRIPGELAQRTVAARVRTAGADTVADVWIAPGAYVAPYALAERLLAGC